jgi:hypothetical protein
VPVAAPTQEVTKAMWAKAMLHNAAEIRSEMPHLPPLQRREASMRVEALSSVAHDLLLRTPVATAPFIQQPTPRLGQPPGRTTGTTR